MPLTGSIAVAAVVPATLERVDLPPITVGSGANNNDDTQMGWATEGFEDEDTEMDVPSDVAFRAVYLALKMAEAPGFLQFILQTPAGWWQQVDYDADDLQNFWNDGDGVLRLPFIGDWDMDDIRCKFLLGFYDDGVLDLGITDQWLEVAREVEEGDLVALPPIRVGSPANNNDENQMGWATEGFEDEATPLDVAATILVRSTHLVLEMPEMPGFMQFILQTPAGWWQQTDYGEDDLAGFWDEDTNRLSLPITGEFDPADLRAKVQIAYYDDGVMDLGITGQWLLVGPPVELAAPEEKPEPPPEGSLPFDMGLGLFMWGDKENQLGWNGDTRSDSAVDVFTPGGLTHRLIAEANWFVIYVDNAPDYDEYEMVQLMIFGDADWSWENMTMEAPTVQLYDTFVPGAIAFPMGGHPYLEAMKNSETLDPDSRNFGIMFFYGGGIESLGISKVMLYADLPEDGGATDPTPTDPDPTPAPADPTPTPPPADDGDGIAWWVWVLIVVGVAVVVVVVVVVAKKKK
jgi:hypothetical protein